MWLKSEGEDECNIVNQYNKPCDVYNGVQLMKYTNLSAPNMNCIVYNINFMYKLCLVIIIRWKAPYFRFVSYSVWFFDRHHCCRPHHTFDNLISNNFPLFRFRKKKLKLFFFPIFASNEGIIVMKVVQPKIEFI